MPVPDTAVRDRLARQRTELANERTLLAYIRTALGFFIVGVPAVWWLDQPYIQGLGVLSLLAGGVCLAIGVRRFVATTRLIAETPERDGKG
jgi:putative membrane protein